MAQHPFGFNTWAQQAGAVSCSLDFAGCSQHRAEAGFLHGSAQVGVLPLPPHCLSREVDIPSVHSGSQRTLALAVTLMLPTDAVSALGSVSEMYLLRDTKG